MYRTAALPVLAGLADIEGISHTAPNASGALCRVDLRLKLYCVPGGGGGGGGADGGAGRGCPHGGEEAVQQVGGGGVLTPRQQGLLHTPDDRVTFPAMQVVSIV